MEDRGRATQAKQDFDKFLQINFTCKTVAAIILTAVLYTPSFAQTYKWTDESGNINFTDDSAAIPEKSRSTAVELRNAPARPQVEDSTVENLKGADSTPPVGTKDVLYIAPLKARGFSYSVDVEVNGSANLNMLVDTGSSFTMLSVESAKKLGYTKLDDLPKMPVSTAGGVTWIYLVELESVKVGGAESFSIEGGISDQLGGGLDGLLGMSFLGEFVYQIDGPGAKLSLKSVRGPDTRGGGDKAWWLAKYNHYVENIRRFTAYKESLETGAPLTDTEIKKVNGFTSDDAIKIIAYYTRLLDSLDRRASAVGAPRKWRVYP